jgi:hypothetical protein
MVGIALILVVAATIFAAKKPKNEAAGSDSVWPTDLNQESLRVAAVEQLYELDASAAQLRSLRSAANPNGGVRVRAAAKGTAKLAATLREFYDALLDGKDDAKIASLRNQVVELSNDDNVQLDDELEATGRRGRRRGECCGNSRRVRSRPIWRAMPIRSGIRWSG